MCTCVGAEQRVPQPVRAPRDDTGKARSCENGKGRKERMRAGSQKHELLVAPRDGVQVTRTQLKHRARRAVLSASCLAGRSAGVGCAPRRDLRQERHCRGRWVWRELFASATLLGLVRGGTQHVVLGFRREGRRKWACASGMGSAGEPRKV